MTALRRPLERLARWLQAFMPVAASVLLWAAALWGSPAAASAVEARGTGTGITPATSAVPYRCDGDPLIAEVHQGAVDAPGIPNSDGGTVPGAFLVLRWRGLQLQLPRTNNAGTPSYTDGRWWWQALDPDHPDFAERRGGVTRFACERDAA
jgi:hypothetical protein